MEDQSKPAEGLLRVRVLDELVQETNASLIPKFLALFFKDIPERMERVEKAVVDKDWVVLQREAHTIGSSSATFGAIALHDHARVIEGLCIEKKYDEATSKVPHLHDLVEKTFTALQAYQDGLGV